MHDQVKGWNREVEELAPTDAAVEGQAVERGRRRFERLEHRDRAHGDARHHTSTEPGVERPAQRFDLGQLRHRG